MTDFRPLVTIGLPTYNRADGFLRSAIECALAQTYDHLEVVVSDNCSADDTQAVVASYADSRIRYTRHATNIGANANFNYCLDTAQGDYFLLFHDDDRIDPDFVETCMAACDPASPPGLIRTGTRIIDGQGEIVYEALNGSKTDDFRQAWRDWFEGRTSYYLCSTLFRTEAVRAQGGFGSPTDLLLDLLAGVNITAVSPWADVAEVKASFRVHGGEMTAAAKIEHWCDDSVHLLDQFTRYSGGDEAFVSEAKNFICRMAYKRCEGIASPRQRLQAMAHVSRRFDAVVKPAAYLLGRFQRRLMSKAATLAGSRKAGG